MSMGRAAGFSTDNVLIEIEKIAIAHDPESTHALQVCLLSAKLFDLTAGIHALDQEDRRMLLAAAMLHDIGWVTRPDAHHKGSRDAIVDLYCPGFSVARTQAIACIARYHRKAHPAPKHKVYKKLSPDRQERVCKLAALIRIADGLDRAHDSSVRDLQLEQNGANVVLYIEQTAPHERNIQGAIRKKELFEQVFDLSLDIVRAE